LCPGELATVRLASALEKNCQGGLLGSPKIIALSADTTKPDFALSQTDMALVQATTTHIIHCAWPVNFALPISSFVPQFASLRNLLALSLSVASATPASFLFCSSVGAAMGTPPPATIPEAPLALSQASSTGYARSKLVAEHIIENAVNIHGARATILRIGQIVPSGTAGGSIWNPNEAIPLAIRSSTVLKVLPDRLANGDRCTWLEADVVAGAIIDICDIEEKHLSKPRLVYNLVHPRSFSWRHEFLPALKATGVVFETVSYHEWLKRLALSTNDLSKNPSRKLLQFWQTMECRDDDTVDEVRFDTREAERATPLLVAAQLVLKKVRFDGLLVTIE
jgi:thioester reductase-like protein